MSDILSINAASREVIGKGASRRLRREQNLVPAIVYGGKTDGQVIAPQNITLKANELKKQIENEAFFSSVLKLDIDGKSEKVIVKDIQRHVYKDEVIHIDFLRVSANTQLKALVPLHFLNEDTCPGVKIGGGNISHLLNSIDVICNASDLPEFIEVDMGNVELGITLHLSELTYPKGVTSALLSQNEVQDSPVVAVVSTKSNSDEDADSSAETEAKSAE
jgi:large subunit ribosomal protein L25